MGDPREKFTAPIGGHVERDVDSRAGAFGLKQEQVAGPEDLFLHDGLAAGGSDACGVLFDFDLAGVAVGQPGVAVGRGSEPGGDAPLVPEGDAAEKVGAFLEA